jgi:hypothetical protein
MGLVPTVIGAESCWGRWEDRQPLTMYELLPRWCGSQLPYVAWVGARPAGRAPTFFHDALSGAPKGSLVDVTRRQREGEHHVAVEDSHEDGETNLIDAWRQSARTWIDLARNLEGF